MRLFECALCLVPRRIRGMSFKTLELSFHHVENEGFVNYTIDCCPMFKIPSRCTVARVCYDMYLSEKTTIIKSLKASSQSVCLTTDTWTSPQNFKESIIWSIIVSFWCDDAVEAPRNICPPTASIVYNVRRDPSYDVRKYPSDTQVNLYSKR
ncbi:hypothetical protein Dimus_038708 [Dionaea muscipula]